MSQSSMTHRLEHKNVSRSVKFEKLTAVFLYVLEKTILHGLSNFCVIWTAPAKVPAMVDFGGVWLMIHHDVIFFEKRKWKFKTRFKVWNQSFLPGMYRVWGIPGPKSLKFSARNLSHPSFWLVWGDISSNESLAPSFLLLSWILWCWSHRFQKLYDRTIRNLWRSQWPCSVRQSKYFVWNFNNW